MGRGDDHPGRALAYYGSRGDTPLRWGTTRAAGDLGLTGEVTPEAYAAAFGPGGFTHPVTGERLARTKRPGFEIVVSAHKSTALLGVVGRAEDMHSILDTETAATMAWLDQYFAERGGRRGEAARPTATTGLVFAHTRHATSRAGDPNPHDHVLVANVCEMLDTRGGHKALFSALLRDTVEAATMVGRLHSAARAVQLGYRIESDEGPSGRLRQWRIAGIPAEVCEIFSKRSDEIAEYLEDHGYAGYRAAAKAARATRTVKRGTGADELLPRWHTELAAAGWSVDQLAAALDAARSTAAGFAPAWTDQQIDQMVAEMLDPDGEFLVRNKTFTRTRLIAEIAPRLYGQHPDQLDRVLLRVLANPEIVPLIGVPGAREQAYTAAAVLATEEAIAERIDHLAEAPGATVPAETVDREIKAKEAEIGGQLSDGQRAAIEGICGSGHGVELIIGVAGAGKTTALDVAANALEATGHRVLGTATSGQAARTLGHEAAITSRTLRSLLWHLDHGTTRLDDWAVVILDEAAMTADADLARLLLAVERAKAKIVLVGDPRQLSPVGPGGAVASVIDAHPEIVTALTENKRQHDPAERQALDHLRHQRADQALDFYTSRDRIRIAPNQIDALANMVDAWAADTSAGRDTFMLAWRRDNVARLNQLARAKADQLGRLHSDDLEAPGGRRYATGDPVVLFAPSPEAGLVTSQRATVTAADHRDQALTIETDDGRQVTLVGEAIDADHLDHAYAMTVHRTQGATTDHTHYLADSGGRELAYVALTRARHHTTIHAVADDQDQALDDLRYAWTTSQAQIWISDTAEPGHDPRHQPATHETQPNESERHDPPPADKAARARHRLDVLRQRPATGIDDLGL